MSNEEQETGNGSSPALWSDMEFLVSHQYSQLAMNDLTHLHISTYMSRHVFLGRLERGRVIMPLRRYEKSLG